MGKLLKIKELKPIRERPEFYEEIERRIVQLFKKQIYVPIIEALGGDKPKAILNSRDDLLSALRTGKITYHRGHFSGRFNSGLSAELYKINAKWESKTRTFYLPPSKLPQDVKSAIAASEVKMKDTINRINEKLNSIAPEDLIGKLHIEDLFDTTLAKIDEEVRKTMKSITVAPQLTPERRKFIAKRYTTNMKLDIKTWSEKHIIELRQKMEKSTFTGYRHESMVKTIQGSYGVAKRKAKFLASQETRLLLTTFKQARYQDAGVNSYKWRCVRGTAAHPVRPRHQELNDMSDRGHIFHFDDPPIVSEPGQRVRRANAGSDFNCRCVSIPIVKFKV